MNHSDEHLPTGSNGEQDGAGTEWERTAWWGMAMAFAAGFLALVTLTGWPIRPLIPAALRDLSFIVLIIPLLVASGLLFQSARLAFRTPHPGLVGAFMLLAFLAGTALNYFIGRAV